MILKKYIQYIRLMKCYQIYPAFQKDYLVKLLPDQADAAEA